MTCCLGSSANLRNSCLFLQSDVSIALDPLYPSRCSWETFGYATSTTMAQASDGLSPLQLSGQLNSLPCSLTFRQEESISIIRLIEQARHATYGIRKCFLFLLQCQLTLVVIQFLSCLGAAATAPEYHRHFMAILLLLPSAQHLSIGKTTT